MPILRVVWVLRVGGEGVPAVFGDIFLSILSFFFVAYVMLVCNGPRIVRRFATAIEANNTLLKFGLNVQVSCVSSSDERYLGLVCHV